MDQIIWWKEKDCQGGREEQPNENDFHKLLVYEKDESERCTIQTVQKESCIHIR